MKKRVNVHWFRSDLRLQDNPALLKSTENAELIPVYIFNENIIDKFKQGEASLTWLYESLKLLNKSLDNNLLILKGDPLQILKELKINNEISGIYWNRNYAPWEIERDSKIKNELKKLGVNCVTFNGSLLWEPWEILKNDGTPYKVFTPFYKNGCLGKTPPRIPLPKPNKIKYAVNVINNKEFNIVKRNKNNWQKKILSNALVGEKRASERLEFFIQNGLKDYKEGRNFPSQDNVSRLAPNLHFGEISPNQIWHKILKLQNDENITHFLSELGWREFSNHLLYHFPHFVSENLQSKFNDFPWVNDENALEKWRRGMTGIPLVDAGMRELWQTGSMHNRLRMVVGSFLVKNLLIDWKYGAKWFWNCLFDADIANNTAGWQWIAGCGADAVPYFRVFNPVTQSEKFDKIGKYIKKFVPELNNLDQKFLHCPWEAPKSVLLTAGVKLGETYPLPIVDLKMSRLKALEAFNTLKSNKKN
ncbi:MAG: cryptochrome/photolyase family protein [Paracoccaceae bacterium]